MTSSLNRILSVEDDDDIRMVISSVLETVCGYTVKICASGDEAIKEAAAFGPDLILLDVMMPGMDGPSTMSKLRAIPGLENTQVIFLTVKAMPSEIDRLISLGAIGVILKPFDPSTLCTEIESLWRTEEVVR